LSLLSDQVENFSSVENCPQNYNTKLIGLGDIGTYYYLDSSTLLTDRLCLN